MNPIAFRLDLVYVHSNSLGKTVVAKDSHTIFKVQVIFGKLSHPLVILVTEMV
jgi:hypothetical protein